MSTTVSKCVQQITVTGNQDRRISLAHALKNILLLSSYVHGSLFWFTN